MSNGTNEVDNLTNTQYNYTTDVAWTAGSYTITITGADGSSVTSSLTIEDSIPIILNDSYTANWMPEYVSDLNYKLDNLLVNNNTVRYMAVWYTPMSDKADTTRTGKRLGQGEIATVTNSDDTVVNLAAYPPTNGKLGRGFQFNTKAAGTSTITVTLTDGTVLHLYIGVGGEAVIPAPAPIKRTRAKK